MAIEVGIITNMAPGSTAAIPATIDPSSFTSDLAIHDETINNDDSYVLHRWVNNDLCGDLNISTSDKVMTSLADTPGRGYCWLLSTTRPLALDDRQALRQLVDFMDTEEFNTQFVNTGLVELNWSPVTLSECTFEQFRARLRTTLGEDDAIGNASLEPRFWPPPIINRMLAACYDAAIVTLVRAKPSTVTFSTSAELFGLVGLHPPSTGRPRLVVRMLHQEQYEAGSHYTWVSFRPATEQVAHIQQPALAAVNVSPSPIACQTSGIERRRRNRRPPRRLADELDESVSEQQRKRYPIATRVATSASGVRSEAQMSARHSSTSAGGPPPSVCEATTPARGPAAGSGGGGDNYYAALADEEPAPTSNKVTKRARRCAKCGETGHYRTTCDRMRTNKRAGESMQDAASPTAEVRNVRVSEDGADARRNYREGEPPQLDESRANIDSPAPENRPTLRRAVAMIGLTSPPCTCRLAGVTINPRASVASMAIQGSHRGFYKLALHMVNSIDWPRFVADAEHHATWIELGQDESADAARVQLFVELAACSSDHWATQFTAAYRGSGWDCKVPLPTRRGKSEIRATSLQRAAMAWTAGATNARIEKSRADIRCRIAEARRAHNPREHAADPPLSQGGSEPDEIPTLAFTPLSYVNRDQLLATLAKRRGMCARDRQMNASTIRTMRQFIVPALDASNRAKTAKAIEETNLTLAVSFHLVFEPLSLHIRQVVELCNERFAGDRIAAYLHIIGDTEMPSGTRARYERHMQAADGSARRQEHSDADRIARRATSHVKRGRFKQASQIITTARSSAARRELAPDHDQIERQCPRLTAPEEVLHRQTVRELKDELGMDDNHPLQIPIDDIVAEWTTNVSEKDITAYFRQQKTRDKKPGLFGCSARNFYQLWKNVDVAGWRDETAVAAAREEVALFRTACTIFMARIAAGCADKVTRACVITAIPKRGLAEQVDSKPDTRVTSHLSGIDITGRLFEAHVASEETIEAPRQRFIVLQSLLMRAAHSLFVAPRLKKALPANVRHYACQVQAGADAIHHLVRLRLLEGDVAVQLDFRSCYSMLARPAILRRVANAAPHVMPALFALIGDESDRTFDRDGNYVLLQRGVGQGEPLSAILLALVIDAIAVESMPETMHRSFFSYSDDSRLISTTDENALTATASWIRSLVRDDEESTRIRYGVHLQTEKCEIVFSRSIVGQMASERIETILGPLVQRIVDIDAAPAIVMGAPISTAAEKIIAPLVDRFLTDFSRLVDESLYLLDGALVKLKYFTTVLQPKLNYFFRLVRITPDAAFVNLLRAHDNMLGAVLTRHLGTIGAKFYPTSVTDFDDDVDVDLCPNVYPPRLSDGNIRKTVTDTFRRVRIARSQGALPADADEAYASPSNELRLVPHERIQRAFNVDNMTMPPTDGGTRPHFHEARTSWLMEYAPARDGGLGIELMADMAATRYLASFIASIHSHDSNAWQTLEHRARRRQQSDVAYATLQDFGDFPQPVTDVYWECLHTFHSAPHQLVQLVTRPDTAKLDSLQRLLTTHVHGHRAMALCREIERGQAPVAATLEWIAMWRHPELRGMITLPLARNVLAGRNALFDVCDNALPRKPLAYESTTSASMETMTLVVPDGVLYTPTDRGASFLAFRARLFRPPMHRNREPDGILGDAPIDTDAPLARTLRPPSLGDLDSPGPGGRRRAHAPRPGAREAAYGSAWVLERDRFPFMCVHAIRNALQHRVMRNDAMFHRAKKAITANPTDFAHFLACPISKTMHVHLHNDIRDVIISRSRRLFTEKRRMATNLPVQLILEALPEPRLMPFTIHDASMGALQGTRRETASRQRADVVVRIGPSLLESTDYIGDVSVVTHDMAQKQSTNLRVPTFEIAHEVGEPLSYGMATICYTKKYYSCKSTTTTGASRAIADRERRKATTYREHIQVLEKTSNVTFNTLTFTAYGVASHTSREFFKRILEDVTRCTTTKNNQFTRSWIRDTQLAITQLILQKATQRYQFFDRGFRHGFSSELFTRTTHHSTSALMSAPATCLPSMSNGDMRQAD